MIAIVTGKRKREYGFVVLAKFTAYKENNNHAKILVTKLLEKQNLLELAVHNEEDIIKRYRKFK